MARLSGPSGPTRAEVRREVQAARDRQRARYKGAYPCNARLDSRAGRKYCTLATGAMKPPETSLNQLGLRARAYNKVLKVARTLADLDEVDEIAEHHVAEAVQYRSLDRQLF
jgi:magnesium chelatase family protein